MTEIELKTKVKIDHEFYKLSLIDHTGYEFTYSGKFTKTPEFINEIVNSDICIAASIFIGRDQTNFSIISKSRYSEEEMNKLGFT